MGKPSAKQEGPPRGAQRRDGLSGAPAPDPRLVALARLLARHAALKDHQDSLRVESLIGDADPESGDRAP